MGHHVHLEPLPLSRNRLSPMMKEICSRKNQIDLNFKCDDGTFGVHKMLVAGQSKFLKKLLLEEDRDEIAEIILPGVKKDHLKLVIRIIYTGSLKMSKKDLETAHTVWYVKEILTNILKFDININLGPYALRKPPDANGPPPGGGGGGGGGGDGPPPPAAHSRPPSDSHEDRGSGSSNGPTAHGPAPGGLSPSSGWLGGANPRNQSGAPPQVSTGSDSGCDLATTAATNGSESTWVSNMAERAVDAETDMAVDSILVEEVDEVTTNDNHSEGTVALGGGVSHGLQFAIVESSGGDGGVPTPVHPDFGHTSTSIDKQQHNGGETGLAVNKWGEELQSTITRRPSTKDSDVEVVEPPHIPIHTDSLEFLSYL